MTPTGAPPPSSGAPPSSKLPFVASTRLRMMGGGVALALSSSAARSARLPHEGAPNAGLTDAAVAGGVFLKVVWVGGALEGTVAEESADPIERRKRLFSPRLRGCWLAVGG